MSRRRYVRRHTLAWIGTAVVASLLLAAFLMRSWTLVWIALPLGVVYLLLLTMPVFLGVVTGDDDDGNKS
ncbi:hypothetical protein [Candidatus Laterigemmans baculatus]|uniref:hypothetical protein n=1 Tax=Candidatus Laterigemmans baculatus TaxID=2770505 RepID=UPI0013DD2DFF|nr:hypothetical protein [Candidatus Laterigemmans baculatus]